MKKLKRNNKFSFCENLQNYLKIRNFFPKEVKIPKADEQKKKLKKTVIHN